MLLSRSHRIERIQRAAGLTGRNIDGISGPITQQAAQKFLEKPDSARLADLYAMYGLIALREVTNQLRVLVWADLKGVLPKIDPMADALLPEEGIQMILQFEGIDQPWARPPGLSGITIGYGYDLQFYSTKEFEDDWGAILPKAQMTRLKKAIGAGPRAAAAMQKDFQGIIISRISATKVFRSRSVPYWYGKTFRTYPGFQLLKAQAQSALVSLVFNRGEDLSDEPGSDRRMEMRAIADLVLDKDYRAIASNIRSMKRLWIGTGQDGLLKRRDTEARAVELCA